MIDLWHRQQLSNRTSLEKEIILLPTSGCSSDGINFLIPASFELFYKYGPLFVYFHSFHSTVQLQLVKSIDVALGI